ncbi:MAG: hypothetical protein KJ626_05080, partial [Verrucomicrobia bacterium]|nr:hypothetical protein [Verrucomicrobiota bacterium]
AGKGPRPRPCITPPANQLPYGKKQAIYEHWLVLNRPSVAGFEPTADSVWTHFDEIYSLTNPQADNI